MDGNKKGVLIWSLITIGVIITFIFTLSTENYIKLGKDFIGIVSLGGLALLYLYLTRVLEWENKTLIAIILVICFLLIALASIFLSSIPKLMMIFGVITMIIFAVCAGSLIYLFIRNVSDS